MCNYRLVRIGRWSVAVEFRERPLPEIPAADRRRQNPSLFFWLFPLLGAGQISKKTAYYRRVFVKENLRGLSRPRRKRKPWNPQPEGQLFEFVLPESENQNHQNGYSWVRFSRPVHAKGKQMSTSSVPKAFQKGLWVHLFGVFLPFREFSEKEVKVTRGKKVSYETETLEHPEALLLDPRDPEQTSGGIRGVAGNICSEGVANPALAGETFFVVEGEKVPFSLVGGLTGTEDGKKKDGSPKARHPKLTTGVAVPIAWNGITYNALIGISQSQANAMYLWGSVRPKSTRVSTADPSDLVSLADLTA